MFMDMPQPAALQTPQNDEAARRQQIRDALLDDARKNFETVAPLADNDYSRDLKKLETDVNDYLKRNPAFNNKVVVLDPNEFDAGIALGMRADHVLIRMLHKQGVTPDAGDLLDLLPAMGAGYDSKYGPKGYTQDAQARPTGTGANTADVVVPAADQDDHFVVKGLSYRDNLEFTNRHETWHVKDSFYDLSKINLSAARAGSTFNDGLKTDADAREAFALQQKKEALADVGALGDMIREKNRPADIIDTVSKWRAGIVGPLDGNHMSVQVLEGFKKEIEKMGVENFRKLDEQQTKEFYHKVTEKYGMTADQVKTAIDYNTGTADERRELEKKAKNDADIRKGVDFSRRLDAATETLDHIGPQTPEDKRIQEQLDKFDAREALQQKAFDLKGKITPATMVEAYGKVEEDLRAKIKDDPANRKLYELEMAKLKETFTTDVKSMDYVEANRKRGVNIVEKEPVLSKFATPAPIAPDEDTAPPVRTAGAPQKPRQAPAPKP